jgi:hypothetical protein
MLISQCVRYEARQPSENIYIYCIIKGALIFLIYYVALLFLIYYVALLYLIYYVALSFPFDLEQIALDAAERYLANHRLHRQASPRVHPTGCRM